MKKQIAFFLLLFLIIISCNNDKNICHLTGKLEKAPDTTTLFLVDGDNNTLFDSIQIFNGLIDYKFPVSQSKYFFLHNKRNQYPFRDQKFLWLEPSEITISGDFEYLKNLKIEGSPSQTEFESYNLFIDNATQKINELSEQIHFKTDEEKKKDTIKIEILKENLSNSIVKFMTNHLLWQVYERSIL